MGSATTTTPKCPNKCTAGVRPVISDDPTVDRWQCGGLDCMRNFSTPRAGFGRSPLIREEGEEEATVANTANLEACSKGCGRTKFGSSRGKGQHERYCKGEPRGEEKAEKPARKATVPKASKSERRREDSGVVQGVIAMLQDKRTERIALLTADDPELQEIDRVLEALEWK